MIMKNTTKDVMPSCQMEFLTLAQQVVDALAEMQRVMLRMAEMTKQDNEVQVSDRLIARAITECRDFIWGNSAYTVVFCVCRDLCGWSDNASLFERKMAAEGIKFPQGTINAAMSRNPYMRLHVSKWGDNGAIERVLKFRDAFEQKIGILA